MHRVVLFAMWLLCACYASPASADRKAILVGVGGYAHMEQLQGPANDVRLMSTILPALQYTDIQVLTDAPIPGARQPTSTEIHSVFASSVASAQRGDLIMVYLTGHGTRVPDEDGDEDDGFDEVFLPIDAAYNGRGGIDNALLDDQIGAYLDEMRGRGANVWLIMDSCFSATGARGALANLRAKDVPPVGKPSRVSKVESIGKKVLGPDAGYLVAFYAAQAYERAWEYDFGSGRTGETLWHGIFTAKLAERLRSAGGLSYQRLYEAVLNDMANAGLMGDGTIQTPFIEGTDLTLTMDGEPAGVRQFPVVNGLLSAGLAQGVDSGSVLTVFEDPADPDSDALGAVQVLAAGAVSSTFAPVGVECGTPAATSACAVLTGPAAEFVTRARFARVVAPSMDTVLRLSAPILLEGEPSPDLEAVLEAAAGIARHTFGTPIELNSSQPDLWVGFASGRIWFARKEGFAKNADRPSNLGWRPQVRDGDVDLAKLLHRAAKAQNLIRIASALVDQSGEINPDQLVIEASLQQSDSATLMSRGAIAAAGQSYSPHLECAAARLHERLPLLPRSATKQCDKIRVAVRGRNLDVPKDVNVIYIDANFGIEVYYRRLQPPESYALLWEAPLCSECSEGAQKAPAVYGPETLVVLVTDAVEVQRPLDLRDLTQSGLALPRGNGMPNPLLDNLLKLTTSGEKSRGSLGAAPGQANVKVYRWTVIPREEIGDDYTTLPGT